MAILVVAGRKGGVGKSTITGNLASEFAAMGRIVAALDADPQHSLAAWAEQGEGMLSRCVQKVNRGTDDLRGRIRAAEKAVDIVLVIPRRGFRRLPIRLCCLPTWSCFPAVLRPSTCSR